MSANPGWVIGANCYHDDEIDERFAYEDLTVTTGTTEYATLYYGDVAYNTALGLPVGTIILDTTSNRPAFIGPIISGGKIRVFSTTNSTTCKIRVLHMKTS